MTVSRSGQLTLTHTSLLSTNRRKRANSGPSTGLVTSGRPMWSTTTGWAASRRSPPARPGRRLEVETTCQPSGAIRSRSSQLVGGCGVDQPPDEVEPHAADPGLVELAQLGLADVAVDGRDPAGPALGGAHGVDHRPVVRAVARGLDDDVAADPRWSRRAKSCSLLASQGVYLRSGRRGTVAGPEDVALRVDRAGRQRERGRGRLGCQSSHPRVFVKDELIGPLLRSLIRSTESRWRQAAYKIQARIVNNRGAA